MQSEEWIFQKTFWFSWDWFRTGLRAADILNLKKENIVLTKNDDDSLTGRIHGTALKTKSQTQINIKLDQISLSILKNRLENTKSDFCFLINLEILIILNTSKNTFEKHLINCPQIWSFIKAFMQFVQEIASS